MMQIDTEKQPCIENPDEHRREQLSNEAFQFLEQDKPLEAEERFMQLYEEYEDMDAFAQMIYLSAFTGKMPVAKALIEERMKKEPTNGILYSMRGILNMCIGDFEGAQVDYETSIQLGYQDVLDYSRLAALYHLDGEFTKALEWNSKALEFREDYPWLASRFLLWRGRTYRSLGQEELARVDWEAAAQMSDDESLSIEPIEALWYLGREDEMRERLEQQIDTVDYWRFHTRTNGYLDIAALLARMGDEARASLFADKLLSTGYPLESLLKEAQCDPESLGALMGTRTIHKALGILSDEEEGADVPFTLADLNDTEKREQIGCLLSEKVSQDISELVKALGFNDKEFGWLQAWPNNGVPHFQHFCFRLCSKVYSLMLVVHDNEQHYYSLDDQIDFGRLIGYAQQFGMIPCLVSSDVNGQGPIRLCSAIDCVPIDLTEACMAGPTPMSQWEMQNFAIQQVIQELTDKGYTLDSFCDDPQINPQVYFWEGDQLSFVCVYAHPIGCKEVPPITNKIQKYIDEGLKGYFANVTISSFWNNGDFNETMEWRGAPLVYGIEGRDEYPLLMPIEEAINKYGME